MYLRDLKKLKTLLVIQEVSGRQLAKAAGYSSHTYMCRLLRGEVKSLDPTAALRIANFLGVPLEDLFVVRVSTPAGRNGQSRGRAA
jgi:transcriptional regulator with XRE-family HTH domain